MPYTVLKWACRIALILCVLASISWGLLMTVAVGNLHGQIKVLEQRVNILSPSSHEKGEDGTIQTKP